jgi:ammonia channel protein AmtB
VGVYSANGLYHERQFPFYFATSLIVGMISTGSLGERARLEPLIGFMIVLQTIIYPVVMSWAWNLQGGFLRTLGYFDRGGSIIIFETGAIAGLIGAVVIGPRYAKALSKSDYERMLGGGKETRKKPLVTLLGIHLEDNIDVDDLYLRKVRKLIKREGEETDLYNINVPLMVIGTFVIVIGWSLLNACGYGMHSLNSVDGRYAAELAFMNTFISGSFSGFICFLLKRHIVIGDHKLTPRYDIRSLCNGYLSGVAAVSAGSGIMKPWSALVTGVV